MWPIIFVFIAFVIYLIYNGVVIHLFGIPRSLSETYYLYKNKKELLKNLFPITMVGLALLLAPAWLEITFGNSFQFLAFLAIGSIIFTGAVPTFKNSTMEDKIHSISALFSAICSILWVIFGCRMWFFIPMWLLICVLISVLTKSWNKAKVFWIETMVFLTTFTSIIAYYFI